MQKENTYSATSENGTSIQMQLKLLCREKEIPPFFVENTGQGQQSKAGATGSLGQGLHLAQHPAAAKSKSQHDDCGVQRHGVF